MLLLFEPARREVTDAVSANSLCASVAVAFSLALTGECNFRMLRLHILVKHMLRTVYTFAEDCWLCLQVTMSDWQYHTLSPDQIVYAALDALVTGQIFRCFRLLHAGGNKETSFPC